MPLRQTGITLFLALSIQEPNQSHLLTHVCKRKYKCWVTTITHSPMIQHCRSADATHCFRWSVSNGTWDSSPLHSFMTVRLSGSSLNTIVLSYTRYTMYHGNHWSVSNLWCVINAWFKCWVLLRNQSWEHHQLQRCQILNGEGGIHTTMIQLWYKPYRLDPWQLYLASSVACMILVHCHHVWTASENKRPLPTALSYNAMQVPQSNFQQRSYVNLAQILPPETFWKG